MRRIAICLSLVLLSSCARYNAMSQCQSELGPAPNAWMGAFGLAGGIAQTTQPEYQTYSASLEKCFNDKLKQPSAQATAATKAD